MSAAAASFAPTRLCTRCGATPIGDSRVCPTCGARVVEIRAPEDALIGKVIDERFEIRSVLGQGGMGTVYRAHQRSVDREVAVKLIDPRLAREVTAVRRFLREAKLASQLSQPNTVSVFDFGQSADGYLYLVMELLDGRTLGTVIREDGPFPLARAVRVGVQLCDALEAAHQLGIIHRDLKPGNVLVLRHPPGRDLVKVLDFGLAKSVLTEGEDITESGHVVGTPRYLAPEQLAGRPPDRKVDLYAVGVILAEVTMGRSLFVGDALGALLLEKRDPPPLPVEVPAALRPIVMRLIEPDPELRLGDAAELREALGALGAFDGARTPPRARPPVAASEIPDGMGTPATSLILEIMQTSETEVSMPSVSTPTPATAVSVTVPAGAGASAAASAAAARRTRVIGIVLGLAAIAAASVVVLSRGPADRAGLTPERAGVRPDPAPVPAMVDAAAEPDAAPAAAEPPPADAPPATGRPPDAPRAPASDRPTPRRTPRVKPPPPTERPGPTSPTDRCKRTPRPPECPPF